jgi:hypothetical protein
VRNGTGFVRFGYDRAPKPGGGWFGVSPGYGALALNRRAGRGRRIDERLRGYHGLGHRGRDARSATTGSYAGSGPNVAPRPLRHRFSGQEIYPGRRVAVLLVTPGQARGTRGTLPDSGSGPARNPAVAFSDPRPDDYQPVASPAAGL